MFTSTQAPSLVRVPHEILVKIALETACVDILGPPADLLSLLCTCRRFHNELAHNNDLLARIFRAKFDTSAVRRRYGPLGLLNKSLASQLKVYCSTLRRIRHGDIYSESLDFDLWVAYFMLSESDGRNAMHLKEWAGVGTFVNNLIRTRLYEDASQGWPLECARNNLAMWIMWFVTDIDTLRAETLEDREAFIKLVLPFVICAFRYPMFFASDIHFDLPLSTDHEHGLPLSVRTAHGPYPHYPSRLPNSRLQTVHFGQNITLVLPPISGAAQLLYMARRGLHGLQIPVGIPENRAEAITRGEPTGPTVADYNEFNASPATRTLPVDEWDSNYSGPINGIEETAAQAASRGESGWRIGLTREQLELEDSGTQKFGLAAPSARWDCDWERITSCYDPWSNPATGASKYWVGSLDGDWVGRMIIPDEVAYTAMIEDPTLRPYFGETCPYLALRPLNITINELHSISPAAPLPCGGDTEGRRMRRSFDDGVQNAYFPKVYASRTDEGVIFTTVDDDELHQYETYVPGKPTSHSKSTCSYCGEAEESHDMEIDSSSGAQTPARSTRELSQVRAPYPREVEELFEEAGVGKPEPESESEPDYGDEDETYFIDQGCTGLQDIVFTGITQQRHGDAWGHYNYYGRLRPWDGLIVLVGIPNDVNATAWGKWIFRGYLHGGQNFSGRWRHYAYDIHSPPYEGPFSMSRRVQAAPGPEPGTAPESSRA